MVSLEAQEMRKKIGSHYYDFDTQHHNKARAYARAERLRQEGNRARVVKVDSMTWEVYTRQK